VLSTRPLDAFPQGDGSARANYSSLGVCCGMKGKKRSRL
jgi:hypothetical protein